MEMNGWLALVVLLGATMTLKVLRKKWILQEQSGSQVVTVSRSQIYKVRLIDDGGLKVKAIKLFRDLTGAGLKEAMDMIESMPCIMLETEDYQKAKTMAEKFRAFGANVSIIEE